MRPVEFTSEEIIKAGQELRAAGRNITGFALRQKIGGGSPARLKQVWDEHLQSQAVTSAEPVAELPPEVSEEVAALAHALTGRLMEMAVEVNNRAVKAAERSVSEVLRSAAEHREQAERELADASQTVEDLESRLDEANTKTAGLEQRLAESQGIQQAQAVELAQVRVEIKMIMEDLRRKQQQVEQLQSERDAARENAAKLSGQVEAMQAQISEMMQALAGR